MDCKYYGADDIDFWCEYPGSGTHRTEKPCSYDSHLPAEKCPRVIHLGMDTEKMVADFREASRKKRAKEDKKRLKEANKIIAGWPKWKRDVMQNRIDNPPWKETEEEYIERHNASVMYSYWPGDYEKLIPRKGKEE